MSETAIMTREQAMDWKGRLCQSAHNFRDLLIEGDEGEAWRALEYPDYTQCLNSLSREFGFSPRHAWRELKAARIERNLLTHGSVGNSRIPERHLRPLSGLEPDQQREVWQEVKRTAPNGKITGSHVERLVRAQREVETPELPTGKYRVIYADPPWKYSNSGFDQSAAAHYPTMTLDDICTLDVPSLAHGETVLFLWATSPLLDLAFQVIAAWGFTYKASMVWDKGSAPSIGWFVGTEHELLLIATARDNTHPKIKPRSVLHIARAAHSSKPDEMYAIIEAMYDGPYVELFARKRREGWDVWGNEC